MSTTPNRGTVRVSLANAQSQCLQRSKLFWFHAFNRDSSDQLVKVLTDGPLPNPNPCTTARNEQTLGISERSVYAYLGTTIEDFGIRALVLPVSAITNGTISPFDTGGLVHHIGPINTWPDQQKRAFLADHSWPYSQLKTATTQYPGANPDSYLEGKCPAMPGPSSIFNTDWAHAVMWSGTANDWRAWTWEYRCGNALPSGTSLRAWTCHTDEYIDLIDTIEDHVTDLDIIDALVDTHIDGGVSVLVAKLRDTQREMAHAP